jgi:hypothetical protein
MVEKSGLRAEDSISNNILFVFRIFFCEIFLYILIIDITEEVRP